MTEREMIVKLVHTAIAEWKHGEVDEKIANHLLSNGVTLQRWIPVTERLPEDRETVLVHGERGGIYTAWCNRKYKNPGWHKLNSKTHYCNPTHWMPLPEPPKE